MTRRYAQISNRVVANEYAAVATKVEALYTTDAPLPAGTIGPNMQRIRNEVHHRLLGNGTCNRPAQLDCSFESICESFVHFTTDQTFQPVLLRRAESYFNVATAIDGYGSGGHYGGSPQQRSHGESFIDLVVHRFGPDSLFLLDEPEAALSVHGQLQLLVRIHDLIDQGCQFIVATHSPLLMAYPDATIYEFDADGPTPTTWSPIDTVHRLSERPDRLPRRTLRGRRRLMTVRSPSARRATR